MGDKRLNDLLRWGIENSEMNGPPDAPTERPATSLTPEIMAALMGGPSDADLMKASMEIVADPEVTLENKLIAFDNFEQLIESLDNANNIANLKLWPPLLEQLKSEESELRKMAAWSIGTAVQNNVKTQQALVDVAGIEPLVELALADTEPKDVRRKAIYALSSACRNYQPAMDLALEGLDKRGVKAEKVDATDMESVDVVINGLREKLQ